MMMMSHARNYELFLKMNPRRSSLCQDFLCHYIPQCEVHIARLIYAVRMNHTPSLGIGMRAHASGSENDSLTLVWTSDGGHERGSLLHLHHSHSIPFHSIPISNQRCIYEGFSGTG